MAEKTAEKTIDKEQLESLLGELDQARSWSPGALDGLRRLIEQGEEAELLRANPLHFAHKAALDENEALDLFLFAARTGLFQLEWVLFCASCGCVVQSLQSLQTVHSHYRCEICAGETDAGLDDYIAVYFKINPAVRRLAFHDPAGLSAEAYYFDYKYTRQTWFRGGQIPEIPEDILTVEFFRQRTRLLAELAPGASGSFEVSVGPDFFAVDESAQHGQFFFPVAPEQSTEPQLFRLQIGQPAPPMPIHSGPLKLEIFNPTNSSVQLFGPNLPASLFELRSKADILIDRPLQGKRLLTHATFRELFRHEVLASDEGIGIRDLTFLFTDLKGSTDLYERIGDLKAFALVREHFEHLSAIIARHRGTIVKTIGDAVMAAFGTPADALAGARRILTEIADHNARLGSDDIILKIGLHRGPAIAVTLNDKVDYFGQSVNIAARVQALAEAEQICITDSVYQADGVAGLLADINCTPEKAQLKGIAEKVVVYRICTACGS